MSRSLLVFFFFFFNDTATTEIYTLSLHDALPIWIVLGGSVMKSVSLDDLRKVISQGCRFVPFEKTELDRKSTRLNSSHLVISYAVFCLKKKKQRYSQLLHNANTSPRTLLHTRL